MSVIDLLIQTIGNDVVKRPDEADLARHLHDYTITTPHNHHVLGVAYPRTVEDVAAILSHCNKAHMAVVPQGGMTGLAGGGVPVGPALILSLERMRSILEIDPNAATLTVEAGAPLELVQNAASEAGFLFPLDLGGRGTAQIGGNASTNAGGNRVLRYGMMRELVLGAEVVLANGTIICSLNKMLKNNAGYDLKHLFLGTEGTLGVITKLVLRLFPEPKSIATALVAVETYADVLALLSAAKSELGATLSAFEAMWPEFYHCGTNALGRQPPIKPGHGIYVLLENMGTDITSDPTRFENLIAQQISTGVAKDAVIAQSNRETQNLWAIRDCPGELQNAGWWPQTMFDVSVPIGEIGAFIEACKIQLSAQWPGVQSMYFGHIADSNLHLSVKSEDERFSSNEVDALIYEVVGQFNGSISAEHGIGSLKKPYLHYSRTTEEISLMRSLKAALDPNDILNPGKIF